MKLLDVHCIKLFKMISAEKRKLSRAIDKLKQSSDLDAPIQIGVLQAELEVQDHLYNWCVFHYTEMEVDSSVKPKKAVKLKQ